ncbi:CYTH and CHAD domain-containing protein [Pseudarthrobacter sp. AL07]|uniref:CYTH and CHAD domain-containing protein n=1 Tax=unclassified Pseudarthrobacter TaxID=2647000 RepID=UPI00249AAFAD|nr:MULTISPECIES: CYTH and CHAD domain-containing protein [unclassified Pseudarthrobacter]MDI3193612.1 CYTH and CHAD domain-containing protein [Pseudarthrobacter sp. AL20]MDI3207878.1 CYTH and CHAD domain-containing protein [Pseudarthrobacter sp. AL07]
MASQAVEVEKKYDVGPDAEVPALADIPGVTRVGEPHVDTLEAVYFDTAGHALAARDITLRRRTGGVDAGWHLKLTAEGPGSDEESGDAAGGSGSEPRRRRELHAPLGQPGVVPDSLLAHVMAYLRGEDAAPVVRLKTRRTTYALYGEDGVHLADLADDRVSAELLGAAGGAGDAAMGDAAAPEGEARTRQWREWELELVHGSTDLFPAAEKILAAAGARPAKHGSKLAKVLALPATESGAAAGPKSPGKKDPVSDLLTAYLAAQIRDILAHDPGVRLEEPEAVHDLRSATRRARSALQAYRRFYNALAVRHLGTELKWLGRVLGVPRDAEVMLDRLRGHMAELPPLLASAVKDRLEDDLGPSRDAAHRKLQMAMVSARYFQLLDGLEAFLDNPPVRPGAAAPARKAAGQLVAKAAKRLQRGARTAKRARRGAEHETALHEVRKDAKRLRHVAESAEPVHGKRATKIAKAARRQQQILGDFHDSVVARDLLAKLAAAPDLPEAVASAYVTLHTRQVQLAADAEVEYRKERKKSRKPLQRGVI